VFGVCSLSWHCVDPSLCVYRVWKEYIKVRETTFGMQREVLHLFDSPSSSAAAAGVETGEQILQL
jgi:hypothetical protein